MFLVLKLAVNIITPVSALVHSSTLVYLLIRFSPSFRYWLNVALLLISVLTIFMAGLDANMSLI
jgi:NADH:ubiquinone oxidoreductase subunit 5 (subunit L)/multisubunit Na+/H+ antiporter MnhA subunit